MSVDRRTFLLALSLLGGMAAGCAQDQPDIKVDTAKRRLEPRSSRDTELRFAVSTMISPRESLLDHRSFAAFLAARIGRPVSLVQRRGYAETNDLLLRGEVDFAFICSGPFAAGRAQGLSLVAVPAIEGEPSYRSLILVRADDPARSIEDLRGSSFAFVDPLSFTGRVYPESVVAPLSRKGEAFFGRTVFSHSHSDSIGMVAGARVRAAAVEDIVFNYLARRARDGLAGLRVLHSSPPFAAPPVVASPRISVEAREHLRAVLLSMHESPEGNEVLQALGFSRFVLVPESAYDEIGRMRAKVLESTAVTAP